MWVSIFEAFSQAFIPLLVLSFIISYWYLAKYMPDSDTTRELREKVQNHADSLQKDQNDKEAMNYAFGSLPNKWLAFGGNFYGLVAVYTYLIIEYRQLADFFAGFESVEAFIDKINLSMIIQQAVEALQNIMWAIAWPYQWMQQVNSTGHIAIWFALAYGGFLLGMKSALFYRQHRKNTV